MKNERLCKKVVPRGSGACARDGKSSGILSDLERKPNCDSVFLLNRRESSVKTNDSRQVLQQVTGRMSAPAANRLWKPDDWMQTQVSAVLRIAYASRRGPRRGKSSWITSDIFENGFHSLWITWKAEIRKSSVKHKWFGVRKAYHVPTDIGNRWIVMKNKRFRSWRRVPCTWRCSKELTSRKN